MASTPILRECFRYVCRRSGRAYTTLASMALFHPELYYTMDLFIGEIEFAVEDADHYITDRDPDDWKGVEDAQLIVKEFRHLLTDRVDIVSQQDVKLAILLNCAVADRLHGLYHQDTGYVFMDFVMDLAHRTLQLYRSLTPRDQGDVDVNNTMWHSFCTEKWQKLSEAYIWEASKEMEPSMEVRRQDFGLDFADLKRRKTRAIDLVLDQLEKPQLEEGLRRVAKTSNSLNVKIIRFLRQRYHVSLSHLDVAHDYLVKSIGIVRSRRRAAVIVRNILKFVRTELRESLTTNKDHALLMICNLVEELRNQNVHGMVYEEEESWSRLKKLVWFNFYCLTVQQQQALKIKVMANFGTVEFPKMVEMTEPEPEVRPLKRLRAN